MDSIGAIVAIPNLTNNQLLPVHPVSSLHRYPIPLLCQGVSTTTLVVYALA